MFKAKWLKFKIGSGDREEYNSNGATGESGCSIQRFIRKIRILISGERGKI